MLYLLAQASTVSQGSSSISNAEFRQRVLLVAVLAIVCFCLPPLMAKTIAKLLRLKDLTKRISRILCVLLIGLTPFIWKIGYQQQDALIKCFRLGIDLAGGTNLVYEVDRALAEKTGKIEDWARSMDNMVGAISRRINPSGAEDVTVRRVGQDRIEIVVPGADQAYVDDMKQRITTLGTLEFQILATSFRSDHKDLIERAQKLPVDDDTLLSGGRPVARWTAVDKKATVTEGGDRTLTAVFRTVKRENEDLRQVLVALTPDDRAVTGKDLVRAEEARDPRDGKLQVAFRLNNRGANRFSRLTIDHKPTRDGMKYRLAIVLDGKIHSAPQLNEPITGGSGVISGDFTKNEIKRLVDTLNAGALDLPLIQSPISEFTISPLLGADVRTKGILSCIVSAVIVVIFMGVYYKRAGMIANLCLLVNLFLLLSSMAFIEATITLPGLAGIALTIGMAVDANVLIYERMREETERGASVKMAIHQGFDKAFSAIFDSNITTLIAAVILYMVGSDQIKGFAVTLFVGIVLSMFTVLYVGRLFFEFADQKRLITQIVMMRTMVAPNWDFMGKRKLCFTGSVIGIVVFAVIGLARGSRNFDIDFLGGTMVTFQFVEPKTQDEIRSKLFPTFESSIALERLALSGESGEAGKRWRLRTVNSNTNEVQAGLSQSLESLGLHKVTAKAGEVSIIPEPKEGDEVPRARIAPYLGGTEFSLTFSEEVTLTTARQAMFDGLSAIVDGDNKKFPQPKLLYDVEGKAGSGTDAASNKVQNFSVVTVRVRKDVSKEDLSSAIAAMEKKLATSPLFEEVTNFSVATGSETQKQAILAMALSLVSMVVYMWFRFENVAWGMGAAVALVHDVLIAAGALPVAAMLTNVGVGGLFGFEDFKINLQIIAALLTIVGYSINDTIVIFDRVREVRGRNPKVTLEMFNLSLNQTLSRTILTATTVFATLLVLYFGGGESIHGFAFCMVVGSISGVYSTIYIASPVVLWMMEREERKAVREKGKKKEVAVAKK